MSLFDEGRHSGWTMTIRKAWESNGRSHHWTLCSHSNEVEGVNSSEQMGNGEVCLEIEVEKKDPSGREWPEVRIASEWIGLGHQGFVIAG